MASITRTEQRALEAVNRICCARVKPQRRFWICSAADCGWKTISSRIVKKCERCNATMQPGRLI